MKGDTQTVIICPGVLLIACCAIAPIATKKEQTMMCLLFSGASLLLHCGSLLRCCLVFVLAFIGVKSVLIY